MPMSDRLRLPALLPFVAMLIGATLLVSASPSKQLPEHRGNFNNMITATGDGAHVLGNPDAKVKLTEYISYTCPHCAHFNSQSQATLALTFIASGKGSIEVRPFIRNAVDLAASLLVNCGETKRFVRLHQTFLSTQTEWMARFASVSDTQRARWENGPMASRMRAIASDLDFYHITENNGLDRSDVDRCLSNEAALHQLAEQTEAATKAGVDATPSFAINGVVLTGTHDWAMLAPQLQARLQ